MTISIKNFYDEGTGSFSYVVFDENSKEAAIIDAILPFDNVTGEISLKIVNEIVEFCGAKKLSPKFILDTHIHADHLSGNAFIKEKFQQAKSAISKNFDQVATYFSAIYQIETRPAREIFDLLLDEKSELKIGATKIEIFETFGHTPCCLSYKIGENIFVGDLIFMPDIGTARVDFVGGSAEQSYESLQKILNLDENFRLYFCHDYPKNRELSCFSTIKEQKEKNILINSKISKEEFIEKRKERDSKLALPKLFHASIQVNILGGKIPNSDPKSQFIKIPYKIKND